MQTGYKSFVMVGSQKQLSTENIEKKDGSCSWKSMNGSTFSFKRKKNEQTFDQQSLRQKGKAQNPVLQENLSENLSENGFTKNEP